MNKDLFDKLTFGNEYSRILSLMESVGIDKIEIEYSGGGDSGGTDGYNAFPAKTKELEALYNDFEDVLIEPMWSKHGSFADDGTYSVNGLIVWDVKNKFVYIEGTDTNYSYHSSGEDSDEEEEVSEETWHDSIFEEGANKSNKDRNFSILVHYVENISKEKLPPEQHNFVLLSAIAGDEDAKEYIGWCENKKEE